VLNTRRINARRQSTSVLTAKGITRWPTPSARPISKRKLNTRTYPLMYRDINTLQAHLRKSRSVQDALHNDNAQGDFTAILAQEPYLVTINNRTFTPGVGSRWTTFYPTKKADRGQEGRPAIYRSYIWIANAYSLSKTVRLACLFNMIGFCTKISVMKIS